MGKLSSIIFIALFYSLNAYSACPHFAKTLEAMMNNYDRVNKVNAFIKSSPAENLTLQVYKYGSNSSLELKNLTVRGESLIGFRPDGTKVVMKLKDIENMNAIRTIGSTTSTKEAIRAKSHFTNSTKAYDDFAQGFKNPKKPTDGEIDQLIQKMDDGTISQKQADQIAASLSSKIDRGEKLTKAEEVFLIKNQPGYRSNPGLPNKDQMLDILNSKNMAEASKKIDDIYGNAGSAQSQSKKAFTLRIMEAKFGKTPKTGIVTPSNAINAAKATNAGTYWAQEKGVFEAERDFSDESSTTPVTSEQVADGSTGSGSTDGTKDGSTINLDGIKIKVDEGRVNKGDKKQKFWAKLRGTPDQLKEVAGGQFTWVCDGVDSEDCGAEDDDSVKLPLFYEKPYDVVVYYHKDGDEIVKKKFSVRSKKCGKHGKGCEEDLEDAYAEMEDIMHSLGIQAPFGAPGSPVIPPPNFIRLPPRRTGGFHPPFF